MDKVPPPHFGAIVSRLNLAIFVFRKSRLVCANRAAETLMHRLHGKYRIELTRVFDKVGVDTRPQLVSRLA